MSERLEWVQHAGTESAQIADLHVGELEVSTAVEGGDRVLCLRVEDACTMHSASCELDRARVAWLIGVLAHWLAEGTLPSTD